MARVFAIWVTGSDDGLDHAVCDDAMVAGIDEGNGRYQALCGAVVIAAPMIEPPGRRCKRCSELLYTPVQEAKPADRAHHSGRARHRLLGGRGRAKSLAKSR